MGLLSLCVKTKCSICALRYREFYRMHASARFKTVINETRLTGCVSSLSPVTKASTPHLGLLPVSSTTLHNIRSR